jgi:hypothetical protein
MLANEAGTYERVAQVRRHGRGASRLPGGFDVELKRLFSW